MASPKMAPDAKYTQIGGKIFVSGNQALVRLPIDQARRDKAAGLKTGGFISGYRGSPLGHLDQDLTRAKPLLEPLDIIFQPGVNEDLAATAVWGTSIMMVRDDCAPSAELWMLWRTATSGIPRRFERRRTSRVSSAASFSATRARLGRLSTSTFWPIEPERSCATKRAIASVGPPAG